MTKKEICASNTTIGVYSIGIVGLQIKRIDAYSVYFTDWTGKAHKAAINYDGRPHFKFNGRRVPLEECMRI